MTRWLALLPRLVQMVVCGALAAMASALYAGFFATNAYVWLMYAVAALGAVSAAVTRRRWMLVAAFGVFLVSAAYLAFPGTLAYGLPSGRTAVELGKGLGGGWARMLTVGVPADVRGDLLATPLLLTWAAAFGATLLALRTRSVLGPIAPPLAAFVAALLFSGAHGAPQFGVTAAFLGLALLLVLVRADAGPRAIAGRRAVGSRFLFGGPVIALIVAGGVAGTQLAPLASGADRFDPRDLRSPPLHVSESITPLALVKPQKREPEARKLFTIEVDGASVDRVRTAALDRYDGTLWTSGTEFLPAGRRLPGDPEARRSVPASARVVVSRLAGPYLPVVGWPTTVAVEQGDGSATGAGGGTVVSLRSLGGVEYRTTGVVSTPDDGIRGASPTPCADCAALAIPDELRARAAEITAADDTAYGKLRLLERHLRELPYSLDAPPGHSVAALRTMVLGDDRRGHAEQHAAAFAVLARALNMPSRVAVGYLLHDPRDRTFTATSHDAHAWAEVHFRGYGWIAFEPTDPAVVDNDPRDREATTVSPQQPDPLPTVPPAPIPDSSADGPPGEGFGELIRRTALITVIVVLTIAVLVIGGVAAEKQRRRWRRRRAVSPAARLLGAWQEAVDRLLELGVRIPVSMTISDISAAARAAFAESAEALATMAPLAGAAAFAGTPPPDDDIALAWALEAELRRALHPRPFSRIRAAIDPRPLLELRRVRRAGER